MGFVLRSLTFALVGQARVPSSLCYFFELEVELGQPIPEIGNCSLQSFFQ
jgi:hypothetical protein